jgi:hypothetical protein
MLTVRLSDEEEKALHAYCERTGLSKSMVVKEAIKLYITQQKRSTNPYDAGSDLFGKEASGVKNKSKTYKKRIKELLHKKHSH